MKKKIESKLIGLSSKKGKHKRAISDINQPQTIDCIKQKSSIKKVVNSKDQASSFKQSLITKNHRRTVSDVVSLVPLQGKLRQKVPKIYKNQIFADIYDEFGNHDRVLDNIEYIDLYEEVHKGSVLRFNDKLETETNKFIEPEDSFKSIENNKKSIKDELFHKLEELAHNSRNRIDDLLKPLTVERHKSNNQVVFTF